MEDHDVLMLHEAVTSEPYNFKPKSSERGKVWESIAAHLNSLKTPEFRVPGQGYSEGSERSICTPDLPAQTKAKRRRESIWDRCPRAHRARYLAGGDSGAREERRRKE